MTLKLVFGCRYEDGQIGDWGSGCGASVEYAHHNQWLVGSNPAR